VESEGAAGDQPDLCVDGLDAGVGQAVVDGGLDSGALLGERACELDERCEPAAARPLQPGVQQRNRVFGGDAVDLAQLLFEQVGAVEPLVGALDGGEPGVLAATEVLGVLPEREAGALELAGDGGLAGLAGLVLDLAADRVERVGHELHDVERVQAAHRVRAALGDRTGDPAGHVGRDQFDPGAALGASASRNASTVARSRPLAAHTSRPVWWSTTTVR
jgi:hypothetical protein